MAIASPNNYTYSENWPLKTTATTQYYPESKFHHNGQTSSHHTSDACIQQKLINKGDKEAKSKHEEIVDAKEIIKHLPRSRKEEAGETSNVVLLGKSYKHVQPRFIALDLSRNLSEPDSLLDLYLHRKKIQHTPLSPEFAISPQTTMPRNGLGIDDDQEAKWIHRDKLTQIEIQEYIDRGREPPPELLQRAARSGEALRSRQQARYSEQISNENKQRLQSPEPLPDLQTDDENDEPFIPEDPRSPAEIASEWHEDDVHMMGKLRASSSKIPLATSSPLPIPVEHLEREAPLRRTRGASEEWDDEYTPQLRLRSRGNSIGSQILLDDDNLHNPLSSSPSKNRTQPKSQTPTYNTRIPNGKARTGSGTARAVSNTRPGTRSGNAERPRTAVNRPEGDPPWMDQMYKPDPMLPPDQQMLPTHAKRMRAEQWQKEGKVGAAYDRELTPMRLHDENNRPSHEQQSQDGSPHRQYGEEQPQQQDKNRFPQPLHLEPNGRNAAWPLGPQQTLDVPKSPSIDHGGYSTMPKVQKVPSAGPLPSPRIESRPEQLQQVDQEKIEKKEKGCGCCVVM